MNRYTIVQVLHTISCNDPPTKGGHDISVIYTFNMPRISAASSVSSFYFLDEDRSDIMLTF